MGELEAFVGLAWSDWGFLRRTNVCPIKTFLQFWRPIQCWIAALIGSWLFLWKLWLLHHLHLFFSVLRASYYCLTLYLKLVCNFLKRQLLAMLWLALNLCARIGCWILIYPALIISFTLLWGRAIISCHLRSLCRRAVLLLASCIFSRSLTGRFLFASKNVWIRWFILLLFFIGLFKFEIFRSYDCRANLLWWLKVLKHQ